MKTSDIVKVNITNIMPSQPRGSQINPTAAVLFIHMLPSGTTEFDSTTDTDLKWKTYDEIKSEGIEYVGKEDIDRITSVYTENGGLNLVYKRLYVLSSALEGDIAGLLRDAIKGNDTQEALATDVINIQLAFDNANINISIAGLANSIRATENPEESKLLFVTSRTLPVGLSNVENVFWQYENHIGDEYSNSYLSAAAMAYLSKINPQTDEIKDYEYTKFIGRIDEDKLVLKRPTPTSGQINFFTKLVGETVLIGGTMTNGVRLITQYFEVIITQKITNRLALLVLNKMNFNDSSYATIFNELTLELDIFTQNGLLDPTFIVKQTKIEFRDDERFTLVSAGEHLLNGYKVSVLPPTDRDLETRIYTGIYIQLAIGQQIRTLDISGVILGGV